MKFVSLQQLLFNNFNSIHANHRDQKLFRNKHNIRKEPDIIGLNDARIFVESLPIGERSLALEFLYLSLRYDQIYISQDKLAKKAGDYSRSYINTLIKSLALKGFIHKINRGYKKTCVYRLSLFISRSLRRSLIQMLSPARILSIAFLLSINKPYSSEPIKNLTQYKIRYMSIFMNIYKPTEIAEEIAKKYYLSHVGSAKLAVYSDESLKYAYQKTKERQVLHISESNPKLKLKDPLGYLLQIAEQYNRERGFKTNWAIFYKLVESDGKLVSASSYLTKEEILDIKAKKTMSAMRTNETSGKSFMSVMLALPTGSGNSVSSVAKDPLIQDIESIDNEIKSFEKLRSCSFGNIQIVPQPIIWAILEEKIPQDKIDYLYTFSGVKEKCDAIRKIKLERKS